MKISYKTRHGVGEWVSFTDDGSDVITISLDQKTDGAITLGSGIFSLKKGEANIKKASIPNGEYHPKVECESGVYFLEGFEKQQRDILPLKLSEENIRDLIRRAYLIEEECVRLKERVLHLEDISKGHNIFDFERKEQ